MILPLFDLNYAVRHLSKNKSLHAVIWYIVIIFRCCSVVKMLQIREVKVAQVSVFELTSVLYLHIL